MPTVFLVRHGQSETDAGSETLCPEEVKLTSDGIEQAKRVAQFFTYFPPLQLIVTSRYKRAKQTAEITHEIFPSVPMEEWEVQEFTYLSSMHYKYTTIEDRRPKVEDYWKRLDPTHVDARGSESFRCFVARVQDFIEQLQQMALEQAPRDCIAVFSHQQFINAVRWLIDNRASGRFVRAGEISDEEMRDYKKFLTKNPISNGTIIRLEVHPELTRWPCEPITEHLKPGFTAMSKQDAQPISCEPITAHLAHSFSTS